MARVPFWHRNRVTVSVTGESRVNTPLDMSETKPNVNVESYVVYSTKDGEKWHRSPTCATTAEVPPGLDAASSLFNGLEMARVGELDDLELCSNCTNEITRATDL